MRGSSDSESCLAAASSISDSNSADSARMLTPSSVTDRNPPSTAILRSFSPSRSTRTMASSTNWATNGMWRGRMPISPTVVRVNRNFAVPDQMFRSTATISTFNSAMPQLPSQLGAETLGFLGQVIKATDQEEGLFGYVIEIALAQAVERFNGLLHRDGRTRLAGELFGCHHVLR
ncbi:cellobiose phosphorylase [Mycobacterium tuberculosis]|uniref:Cellobiose phosphorylase n=1 Tax=Mycobacterium tuberculosis TaxID=1773 RepID=A0A654U276_MYCTX|nr:cellobiose phosphorylase [Mycobacterium tuberculosis]